MLFYSQGMAGEGAVCAWFASVSVVLPLADGDLNQDQHGQ